MGLSSARGQSLVANGTRAAKGGKLLSRAHQPRLFASNPGVEAAAHAERLLLDLADHIYVRTSLKPISKALFLISRALLVVQRYSDTRDAASLCARYAALRKRLGAHAPEDDFQFDAVVSECATQMSDVLEALRAVEQLTRGTDRLGLAFDTLLRGKFEGGEGLGTFLTPEEIVDAMVSMLLAAVDGRAIDRVASGHLLYGDPCGGTGRFVYALARKLSALGASSEVVERSARLFDQSQMAVDFGRLNFLFEDLRPTFARVEDSLISSVVTSLRGRFGLIATNPPFGSGKYPWSAELAKTFPHQLLNVLGLSRNSDATDPAGLFLFRALDLLAQNGAVAIVLPDGLVQSREFVAALRLYEQLSATRIAVRALVSLPAATFSLGGTVAKTSFLVITKDPSARQLYVATPHHVGFLKRGNRRVADPKGNELPTIVGDFASRTPSRGRLVGEWRTHERLATAHLTYQACSAGARTARTLADLATTLRVYTTVPEESPTRHFHVSILDVDETGLIDVLTATRNRPTTKGLSCRPGDVIVSCINPKIWRVALIPDLPGEWSCSAEFVVLRPKLRQDGPRLALALHHVDAINAVRSLAGGTSSSRQRVPKELIANIGLPAVSISEDALNAHLAVRTQWYQARLGEGEAFLRLHNGESDFSFSYTS